MATRRRPYAAARRGPGPAPVARAAPAPPPRLDLARCLAALRCQRRLVTGRRSSPPVPMSAGTAAVPRARARPHPHRRVPTSPAPRPFFLLPGDASSGRPVLRLRQPPRRALAERPIQIWTVG